MHSQPDADATSLLPPTFRGKHSYLYYPSNSRTQMPCYPSLPIILPPSSQCPWVFFYHDLRSSLCLTSSPPPYLSYTSLFQKQRRCEQKPDGLCPPRLLVPFGYGPAVRTMLSAVRKFVRPVSVPSLAIAPEGSRPPPPFPPPWPSRWILIIPERQSQRPLSRSWRGWCAPPSNVGRKPTAPQPTSCLF